MGEWLAATFDGPVRTTSIQACARTISQHQPQTAAQWAMTLPPGQDRDKTLKRTYNNWRKDAPEAAAFAQEHGIE